MGGSSYGGDSSPRAAQGSSAQEEKFLVSVRVRPLNERELSKSDVSDWDCINDTTIMSKSIPQERSMFPTAYTFDRVFSSDCPTRQVYDEAAKKVALSVVNGINASIFAYGQTSSGKTYTMSGITEYALADMYDYVNKNEDREFVLKFSAMEIYNECVRDLLSSENTPLRLLDDPERGTVVEKITEVTLRDWNHLKELLSICEAQRQVGETSLNEMSSRSHQILRLTVESSARRILRSQNSSSLAATVNFVDLAGSERASQTLSAGSRLKEGCHINRSLLTLGTIIRKLSKGRNAHIPYRDSKLTRILQNSLGGNARTAIICTMSPALSHVEQSRNTLLFASCAKQVSNSAHVNVVMSEKALVKQLQKELARLYNELRELGSQSGSCNSASALKEKELLIEKMDREIRELTQQRDFAHSRLQLMFRAGGVSQRSRSWAEMSNLSDSSYEKGVWLDDYAASEASEAVDPHRSDVASSISHFSDRYEGLDSNKTEELENEDQFLSDDTSPTKFIDKYFGPDPSRGWEKMTHSADEKVEDISKEVQSIEIDPGKNSVDSEIVPSQQNAFQDSLLVRPDDNNDTLKQNAQEMKDTSDCISLTHSTELSPCSSDTDMSDSRSADISRSRSCTAIMSAMSLPPALETAEDNMDVPPHGFDKESPEKVEGDGRKVIELDHSDSQLEEKEDITKVSSEEIIDHQHDCGAAFQEDDSLPCQKEIGDRCMSDSPSSEDDKPMCEKQFKDNPVLEVESTPEKLEDSWDNVMNMADDSKQSPLNWSTEFEKQRREIIELWDVCQVPLVHRTYFFQLFKGEPSDAVYIEVEQRRLSYLKNTLSQGTTTQASSVRALRHEREKLSRQMLKKFSRREREELYEKWGIGLKSKQRRGQLCRMLWTNTKDMEHIEESASLVAKLVGIVERAPKEIFGLSLPESATRRTYSWKYSLPSLL